MKKARRAAPVASKPSRETSEKEKPVASKPSGKRLLARLGVIVIFVAIALLVKTFFIGAAYGEACEGEGSCKGYGGRCLTTPNAKYCSKRCDDDATCGAGWGCVKAQWVDPHDDKNVKTDGVCVKRGVFKPKQTIVITPTLPSASASMSMSAAATGDSPR